jgi:hypothetical protein
VFWELGKKSETAKTIDIDSIKRKLSTKNTMKRKGKLNSLY